MPHTKRTVKGVLGGLLGLVGLSAIAGLLVTASVTPAIAMAGFTGSQALTLFDELPSYMKPSTPMAPTTIYGTNSEGKPFKMATFYEQNRTPVTFKQLSPTLVDAVLSSEDKNYYSHGGVNLLATAKAALENFSNTSSRGASTITQQYVKNALIQQCEQTVAPDDDRYADKMAQCFTTYAQASGSAGIERKLQEMRYAIQIEKDYSKNDILLGYLNLSNFGGTTYGIEAAAQRYFSTSSSKLSLVQAATLAGMVQEPNKLRIDQPKSGTWTDKDGKAHNNAADGYETTKERRDYVLGQMLENGQITEKQYDEAVKTPVTPKLKDTKQGCAAAGDNAYFCQYALSVVTTDEAFGKDRADRLEKLRRGGMKIYTSLDMRVQKPAVESMRRLVPAKMPDILVGSAGVSIEATTGRILSIVQNTQFSESAADEGKRGISSQIFAADQAHNGGIGFSVGSTYKLFTLIDWLEKGHSVNQVLDGRKRLITPFTRCGQQWNNPHLMENFGDGGGFVGNVRQFTSASLNTGFLAMAQQLDLCEINEVAKRMGVHIGSMDDVTVESKNNPAPNDPFSTVLGSKNIAPIQMAGAYATVANKGKYCEPRVIDKVIGQDGKEIPAPKTSCSQVISPEVAATAAYALRGVMEGGTGVGANPYDGTQLIGKTGTAEKEHTMLVESSTRVTTAVWVGNIIGEQPLGNYWANGIALNQIRYYLAKDLQAAANAAYPAGNFPEPDKKLTRVEMKDLPNVVDMKIEDAKKTLEAAGFRVTVGKPVDSDKPTDVVAEQSPGAGRVPMGSTVTISPSNGKGAKVPNVVGQLAAQAQGTLLGAGFTNVQWDGSCNPAATVSETDPKADSSVSKNQAIKIKCEEPDDDNNGKNEDDRR